MGYKSLEAKQRAYNLSKILMYIPLILLAIAIIVPVFWVFMASVKENSEFYRSPWALPSKLHWENFANAWSKANMGSYMLNSVIVTALGIVLLIVIH